MPVIHDELAGGQAGVEPGTEDRVEQVAVTGLQDASKGRFVRHHVLPDARMDPDLERGEYPLGGVRGPLRH